MKLGSCTPFWSAPRHLLPYFLVRLVLVRPLWPKNLLSSLTRASSTRHETVLTISPTPFRDATMNLGSCTPVGSAPRHLLPYFLVRLVLVRPLWPNNLLSSLTRASSTPTPITSTSLSPRAVLP